MTTLPSWGTITMALASPGDLARFVDHHLALGASQAILLLDDPEQVVPESLLEDPRVVLRWCDERYWAENGTGRPDNQRLRQGINSQYGYNQSTTDWVAHIDIDEFLLPRGGKTVAELLGAVSRDVRAVQVIPAEYLGEASRALGKPVFKRHIHRFQQDEGLHRDLYPQFGDDVPTGFLGHVEGKAFLRTGQVDLRVGIHRGFDPDDQPLRWQPLRRILLGHTHVRSENEFVSKTPFRLERGGYVPFGSVRRQGISDMLHREYGQHGTEGLLRIYREFYNSDDTFLKKLEAANLLFRPRRCQRLLDERDGQPYVGQEPSGGGLRNLVSRAFRKGPHP